MDRAGRHEGSRDVGRLGAHGHGDGRFGALAVQRHDRCRGDEGGVGAERVRGPGGWRLDAEGDAQLSAEVLGCDRDDLEQGVAVGEGGQAQPTEPDDSAVFVAVSPLAPEEPLPQVEHATVLEDLPAFEADGLAVHRHGQAGPVRCSGEERDRGRVGTEVVDAGQEGGRRGERAALGQRAACADVAVGDGEDRFELVLPRDLPAVLDQGPARVVRRRDRGRMESACRSCAGVLPTGVRGGTPGRPGARGTGRGRRPGGSPRAERQRARVRRRRRSRPWPRA